MMLRRCVQFSRSLASSRFGNDWVFIEGVTAFGRHGVFPEEKRLGQRFVVDVHMRADLSEAGRTDDHKYSVDYAEVFELVKTVIQGPPKNTVEAVATHIAEDILSRHKNSQEVIVRITKPCVALDGVLKAAGVEIRRERHSESERKSAANPPGQLAK